MHSVKSRIEELIAHYRLSTRAFERRIGVSNGYLKQIRHAPSVDRISSILDAFPEIDRVWLLTGEGSMLREPEEERPFVTEVVPVPEDAYMMVEYADLSVAAGRLGGGDVQQLPDTKRRLLPREYESGNYLVVSVSGDSMNDGTIRSLSDGDEVLVKEIHIDPITKSLPIRNSLFVITSRDGNVLKQITELNYDEGYMTCHSFNPLYSDFRVELADVYQVFQVCKIVQKQIRLM